MNAPSTKRQRPSKGRSNSEKPTARVRGSRTKPASRSSTRRTTRTPVRQRPVFIPVSIEPPPDGYFYLELISQDTHAIPAIERELCKRTLLAERCYMQSKIPVYRIPEGEAKKMEPWPFTQGQKEYAGCSLPANNKEKETYVFRNRFSHSFLLKGTFEMLRTLVEKEKKDGAATTTLSPSKSPKRRRRSRISAE